MLLETSVARHKKTQANIDLVMQFASVGQPQSNIARCLGIAEKTLRANYRKELDTAKATAVTAMAGRLFQAGMDGDVGAMKFFLQCQGAWNPKQDQTININHTTDLPQLMAQGRQRALEAATVEEPKEPESSVVLSIDPDENSDGKTIN